MQRNPAGLSETTTRRCGLAYARKSGCRWRRSDSRTFLRGAPRIVPCPARRGPAIDASCVQGRSYASAGFVSSRAASDDYGWRDRFRDAATAVSSLDRTWRRAGGAGNRSRWKPTLPVVNEQRSCATPRAERHWVECGTNGIARSRQVPLLIPSPSPWCRGSARIAQASRPILYFDLFEPDAAKGLPA